MNNYFNKDKQKLKYVTGNYKSLRDFSIKENINYNYLKNYAKGWNKDKKEYQLQINDKTITEIQKRDINREIKANERHIEIWDKLLDILENSLSDNKQLNKFKGKDNLHNAVKSLAYSMEKAQEGQRKALGLDNIDNSQDNKIVDVFTKMADAFGEMNEEKDEGTKD